ncbi:hypothetical protein BD413DRAFT_533081 [Trametes elegans]|nr:hypothetical protein BD413DRAFT_533081 [Trametes elegans]
MFSGPCSGQQVSHGSLLYRHDYDSHHWHSYRFRWCRCSRDYCILEEARHLSTETGNSRRHESKCRHHHAHGVETMRMNRPIEERRPAHENGHKPVAHAFSANVFVRAPEHTRHASPPLWPCLLSFLPHARPSQYPGKRVQLLALNVAMLACPCRGRRSLEAR